MNGNCLCGAVEFEVDVSQVNLYQCHCKLCRKQSGSCSNAATIVPAKSFKWVQGESSITHWQKESGFRSDFCKVCGSPVPNPLRDTGYVWVPAGLLENEQDLKVVSHIYTASKATWDQPNPDAATHEDFPDGGLEGHIQSLKR
ncbi:GFA family protein [Corallincola platygyrae]|uniref:GFA family protein n=1 Tax=Corallincola platygyrae TaxID=1193278 RepID=A0ABW4XLU7_9GAMM